MLLPVCALYAVQKQTAYGFFSKYLAYSAMNFLCAVYAQAMNSGRALFRLSSYQQKLRTYYH